MPLIVTSPTTDLIETGTILSPYRVALGPKHRIYASPQWIQVDKQWAAIDDAIEVIYNGHESYEIRLGKKDRIFMEPLWDAMPHAISRVVNPRKFGPTIDFKTVSKKDVSWRITTIGAVSRTAEGWIFDRCTPKICGLFFDKWHGLMPKAVTETEIEVSINVKTAVNDLSLGIGMTIANLDPETVYPITNGYAKVWRSSGDAETWQQTIDGAGTSNAAALECRAWTQGPADGQWKIIVRGLLRFDTSAYPTPIDAYLRLTADPPGFNPATERDYLATQGALTFPLASNLNYIKGKTAIDSHGVGAFTAVGDPDQGFRKSPDIVAAEEWEQSATADFVVSEYHDYEEDEPGDATNYQINYALPASSYLLITPGAFGNRIPLMKAGIS